ncbi:hypothetical protein D9M69_689800 [compost metagenome]
MGCGHGALTGREMLAELPELVERLVRGMFHAEVRRLPLSEVTRGWQEESGRGRLVFTP